jgi:hypothetical protein
MVSTVPLRWVFVFCSAVLLLAQDPTLKFPLPEAEAPEAPVEFVCPMDPDIRSKGPGKCSRCGMALVAGIPDPVEYPVDLKITPKILKPGKPIQLAFAVRDPKTEEQVEEFEIMHEKLFHMFIVSQDLAYFIHDHPVKGDDSVFRFEAVLPKPGMYRVLSDFYPKGGTPQMIARTIVVPGAALSPGAQLKADLEPQKSENLTVSLTTEPPQPIAGMKTLMFFKLEPGDGIEPYLAAWGHMMAASQDLVDMIHNHPFLANGGPNVQFNMIFPRPGVYRVWVQFQRKGVVNTVAFNVPVTELR